MTSSYVKHSWHSDSTRAIEEEMSYVWNSPKLKTSALYFLFLMHHIMIFFLIIYLFSAVLGLHSSAWALSGCGKWGLSPLRRTGFSLWRLLLLWSTGSGLRLSSCGATCGISPDQESNPCPLHWQVNSYPLCHQESPCIIFKKIYDVFIAELQVEYN